MRRSVYVVLVSLLLGGAWLSPALGASFTFTTIDVPGSFHTGARHQRRGPDCGRLRMPLDPWLSVE